MATKYITAVLLLSATSVFADHSVEHNAEDIDANSRRITSNLSAISSHDGDIWENERRTRDLSAGIALSNALGGHQFDFDHYGTQMSVGMGAFDGYAAGSIGFAFKPKKNALVNFAFGHAPRGESGGSIHLNLRF